MANPVKLDRELHSGWDVVAHDTIVGADLALHNAYLFHSLEHDRLPFRCSSELVTAPASPIAELDDAIRTCKVLDRGPRDRFTRKPCRMGAFGWAELFPRAQTWVRGSVPDATFLGRFRGLASTLFSASF